MAIPDNGASYSPMHPWLERTYVGDTSWTRFIHPHQAAWFPAEFRVALEFDALMVRMGVTIQ